MPDVIDTIRPNESVVRPYYRGARLLDLKSSFPSRAILHNIQLEKATLVLEINRERCLVKFGIEEEQGARDRAVIGLYTKPSSTNRQVRPHR